MSDIQQLLQWYANQITVEQGTVVTLAPPEGYSESDWRAYGVDTESEIICVIYGDYNLKQCNAFYDFSGNLISSYVLPYVFGSMLVGPVITKGQGGAFYFVYYNGPPITRGLYSVNQSGQYLVYEIQSDYAINGRIADVYSDKLKMAENGQSLLFYEIGVGISFVDIPTTIPQYFGGLGYSYMGQNWVNGGSDGHLLYNFKTGAIISNEDSSISVLSGQYLLIPSYGIVNQKGEIVIPFDSGVNTLNLIKNSLFFNNFEGTGNLALVVGSFIANSPASITFELLSNGTYSAWLIGNQTTALFTGLYQSYLNLQPITINFDITEILNSLHKARLGTSNWTRKWSVS